MTGWRILQEELYCFPFLDHVISHFEKAPLPRGAEASAAGLPPATHAAMSSWQMTTAHITAPYPCAVGLHGILLRALTRWLTIMYHVCLHINIGSLVLLFTSTRHDLNIMGSLLAPSLLAPRTLHQSPCLHQGNLKFLACTKNFLPWD